VASAEEGHKVGDGGMALVEFGEPLVILFVPKGIVVGVHFLHVLVFLRWFENVLQEVFWLDVSFA
jgi:hypothetical protein